MPKTLILTQCYVTTEERGRLLAVNLELIRRLNPGFHILLIDNASPIPAVIEGSEGFEEWELEELRLEGHLNVFRFDESIGHFSHKFVDERDPLTARDGPGRAIMTGLRIAINSGYDRCVYVEDDCLFAKPLEEGFSQMRKPVACLPRGRYGYLETNVMWFADLHWLDKFDLIGRYDWPTQKQGPGREGERIYEAILGEHLQVLPYKGGRGEGFTNKKNLTAIYPEGVDFITHVSRETYAEFLRLNGFKDLASKL